MGAGLKEFTVFLFCLMHATCLTYLILLNLVIMMFGKQYAFSPTLFTSFLVGPDIFLKPFPQTLSVYVPPLM
jgi:hypothetical protein